MTKNLDVPIYFTDVFADKCLLELCQTKKLVLLTDDNVRHLHADKLLQYLASNAISANLISVLPGESTKTRATKSKIEDKMFHFGCDRNTIMIALGGGVITDLAGFVAATFCRGIASIYIPTSLLAMVDAAIGGKTAVNTPYGKNTIGTFTQPKAIFIDEKFLHTLPDFEIFGAMSEIIKHALIYDPEYFLAIESCHDYTALIYRSCKIKQMIVADDVCDLGKRAILNFGHTIAHALETAHDYELSHGAAVAYGLIAESFISNRIGVLSDLDFTRIQKTIYNIACNRLKVKLTASIEKVLTALKFDKKKCDNGNRFVILEQIGKVLYTDSYTHVIEQAIVKESLQHIYNMRNLK